jgi:hypothetical protein
MKNTFKNNKKYYLWWSYILLITGLIYTTEGILLTINNIEVINMSFIQDWILDIDYNSIDLAIQGYQTAFDIEHCHEYCGESCNKHHSIPTDSSSDSSSHSSSDSSSDSSSHSSSDSIDDRLTALGLATSIMEHEEFSNFHPFTKKIIISFVKTGDADFSYISMDADICTDFDTILQSTGNNSYFRDLYVDYLFKVSLLKSDISDPLSPEAVTLRASLVEAMELHYPSL